MLGYDTVIRRTWVMAAGSNLAFKSAAKPLQINMVSINRLQKLFIALSNGTIADLHVSFSYNTCITDRQQTTDRRHIVPNARL